MSRNKPVTTEAVETAKVSESALNASVSEKIIAALQGLRFGSVELTVHDGRIVQIERKEKVRLEPSC